MAAIGADYQLSGFRWADPERITYSIAPDGVFWKNGTNRLNEFLDASVGPGRWEREIARALATWQAAANLNIVPVADSNRDLDAPGQAQGDPRFGDIRIGGFTFPGNTTTLAQTYFPPPNGNTASGDIVINTGLNFRIGADFDLYSVLLHETGHSLGLDHPTDPSEVLHARYGGIREGLSAGDLAGIQAIYGPRQPDSYRQAGLGTSLATAIDVTPALDASGDGRLSGVSLSQVGETEYFGVVAPAGTLGRLRVTAAASGTSLLSPSVSVLDAEGRVLDTAADPAAWSNDVTAEVRGVTSGQRFFVAVTGATSDAFAVGAYSLSVAFETAAPAAPSPTPPPPAVPPAGRPVPVDRGPAPDRFEPNNDPSRATPLGSLARTAVTGLSLHAPGDLDYFRFTSAGAGVYFVDAAGAVLRVLGEDGEVVAQGSDRVGFRVNRAGVTILVAAGTAGDGPLATYALSISSVPSVASKAAPTLGGPWFRWTSWRAFSVRRSPLALRGLTLDEPESEGPMSWSRLWALGRPPALSDPGDRTS